MIPWALLDGLLLGVVFVLVLFNKAKSNSFGRSTCKKSGHPVTYKPSMVHGLELG